MCKELHILIGIGLVIISDVFANPILKSEAQSQKRAENESSCTIDSNYRFMSSKTAYETVANTTNFDDYTLPKCTQIGVWMLSRHGERYPERKDIIEMESILKRIKDQLIVANNNKWLCKSDMKQLETWKFNMTADDDFNLTKRGRRVMREYGERMKKRLAQLFGSMRTMNFSTRVNVQATNVVRTRQSADEFINGIFNGSSTNQMPTIHTTLNDDFLLKYPDICSRFIKTVSKNASSCPELNEFLEKTDNLKQAREVFFERLGLNVSSGDRNKTFSNVLKACQFDYLINENTSIWCKFFDKKILKEIEYQEDIKYNCRYSYRHNISRDMACDLLNNLLSSMNEYKNGFESKMSNSTALSLFFTHTSGMLPFLANFGIGKNATNFNASDILAVNENRAYRLSKLDPMNSNIVFVVYACDSRAPRDSNDFKIRVFLNENLIKLEACKTVDCSFDDIKSYLSELTTKCVSSRHVCALN